MKLFITLLLAVFTIQCGYAQMGCTNPLADNYDPDAVEDDGSCNVCGQVFNHCYDNNSDFSQTFCDVEGGSVSVYMISGTFEPGFDLINVYDGSSNLDPILFSGDGDVSGLIFVSSGECLTLEITSDASFSCATGEIVPEFVFAIALGNDESECSYQVSGKLFFDANSNGVQDEWEGGLENIGVSVPSHGYVTYTTENGHFYFLLEEGSYSLDFLLDDGWFFTTPPPTDFDVDNFENLGCFGLNTTEEFFDFYNAVECCVFMNFIHCNDGFNPGSWLHNTGNAPLNGTFTITFDPLFEVGEAPNGWWDWIEPDFIGVGEVSWNLVDYPVGASDIFRIHLLGPGPDYLGQFFDVNLHFEFYNSDEELVIDDNILLQPEVLCAYDPNDKYSIPEGYSEPHFINAGDDLQFRIRFQNTGNLAAEEITIRDTLDANLDWTSFEPLFASHDVQTNFNLNNGAIEFQFDDINLPDSASEPVGSQGFVVFNVRPLPDLEPGTEINNTAHIFFEENPAIVTNTTWHTIYNCNELELLDLFKPLSVCEETPVNILVDYEYADIYEWNLNDEPVGDNESELDFFADGNGIITIGLIAGNPLCTGYSELEIEVVPLPQASITENGADLSAFEGEGYSYQWYLNGVAIEGANASSYLVTENGDYHYTVVNDIGCESISDSVNVIVTGIEQGDIEALILYPNPASDFLNVQFSSSALRTIRILNTEGKVIETINNSNSMSEQINIQGLATGTYFIEITDDREPIRRAFFVE